MSTKVEIVNYKTMKSVSFEFEGYTLLLGHNFIGKSAVIGALVSALTNRTGDDFIRHGEKYCEVTIQRDGHTVVWHKETNNSYYLIDGKEYKKIGKGNLPDPIKEMGFGPLVISGEKTLLWYARQFESLFLIDRNRQNYATDLIASVSDLDPLYKAVDLVKKDIKSFKAELKVRAMDIKDARKENEKYSSFEDYKDLEENSTHLLPDLEDINYSVKELEGFISNIEEDRSLLTRYAPSQKLRELKISDIEALVHSITKIQYLSSDYKKFMAGYQKMAKAGDLEKASLGDLRKQVEAITFIERSLRALRDGRQEVMRYEGYTRVEEIPLPLDDARKCLEEIQGISSLNREYQKSLSQVRSLEEIGSLAVIPFSLNSLDEIKQLEDFINQIDTHKSMLVSAAEELKSAKKSLEEAKEELSKIDSCPACGASL